MIDILFTWPSDGLRLFESMQPLGLLSVATVAQQAGYGVQLIDFNHYKNDFRLDLLKLKPKMVGIGGTTATRKSSFLTARLVKEVLPNTVVVYGGPHATFAASDTLTFVDSIDYVIQGEGEYSFLELASVVFGKSSKPLNTIAGLAWREQNTICINKPERIQNLEALPIPSRDLLPAQYPITIDQTTVPAAILVTSRGCPALCDFCAASKLFPGGVRFRSIAQVQEEVVQIVEKNPQIKGLKIFDSTFTASKEHVQKFCAMIQKYDLVWECEVRADSVDYELLQLMKQAGCIYINVGLESSNEQTLKQIGKRIQTDQVNNVLDWCKQLHIITKVFFTFGHLDQTQEQMYADLRYMKEMKDKIDLFATTIGIRVYPGTILERKLQKRGLLPHNFSWVHYSPPLKNLLLLEPADVMILEQKQLSLYRLAILIPRLFWNQTVLSPEFIKKSILQNAKLIVYTLQKRMRYVRQVLYRKIVLVYFRKGVADSLAQNGKISG
jgi:anaerobic magnesium-protoporphyrin IX monomethyl ester cyclase